MIIVAGPPGSGKSAMFPLSSFGVDFFNADDRSAELNGGSYVRIAPAIRQRVNRAFEAFILDHIDRRMSFALETTLRSTVTFDQCRLAQSAGFVVEMPYLALPSFDMHLERVKMRADRGGHSASEPLLRSIYDASMANLPRAIREMDLINVYDNGNWGFAPRLLLQAEGGELTYLADRYPDWLSKALARL